MFGRKRKDSDPQPAASKSAGPKDSASAAKEENQRQNNIIEDQAHRLDLQWQLLALHEQVGTDLQDILVGLRSHSSASVRETAETLIALDMQRLSRLPRQLLEGDAGASAGFEHFIGYPRNKFELPAVAVTELLVYRTQTIMAMIADLLLGKNITPERVTYLAQNDVEVMLNNEKSRQRLSSETRRR